MSPVQVQTVVQAGECLPPLDSGIQGLEIGQGGDGSVVPAAKKSSFQITSVIIKAGSSSISNDGCDSDFDESHTEDSSDVTADECRVRNESRGLINGDNNMFTSNDVFYNSGSFPSANTAPVIPTCPQYGLAIVPDTTSTGGTNTPGSTMVPNTLPVNHDSLQSEEKNDVNQTQNRFKVVKIVSNEPFQRGRWVCMDYMDETTTKDDTNRGQPVPVRPNGIEAINANPNISPQTTETNMVPSQPLLDSMSNIRLNGDITHSYVNQPDVPVGQTDMSGTLSGYVVNGTQAQNSFQNVSTSSTSNPSQIYSNQPCQQQQQYYPTPVSSGVNVGVMPTSSIQTITSLQSQPISSPQSQFVVNPMQANLQNVGTVFHQQPQSVCHQTQTTSQPHYVPGQSLPHGAHAAVLAAAQTTIVTFSGPSPSNGTVIQTQATQGQRHTTQSLGHNNNLQQSIAGFVSSAQTFQQVGVGLGTMQGQVYPQSTQQMPQQIPIPQQQLQQQPQVYSPQQVISQYQLSQPNYQYSNQQKMGVHYLQEMPPNESIPQSQVYTSTQMMGQVPMDLHMMMPQQTQQLLEQQIIHQQIQQQQQALAQAQQSQIQAVNQMPQGISPNGTPMPIQANVVGQPVVQGLPAQNYSQSQPQPHMMVPQSQNQQFVQHTLYTATGTQQIPSVSTSQVLHGTSTFELAQPHQMQQQIPQASGQPQQSTCSISSHVPHQQVCTYSDNGSSSSQIIPGTVPVDAVPHVMGIQSSSVPLGSVIPSSQPYSSSELPSQSQPTQLQQSPVYSPGSSCHTTISTLSSLQQDSGNGIPQQQQQRALVSSSIGTDTNIIVEKIRNSVVNSIAAAAKSKGKTGEEGESASGTNTVAIDNKIEQAMDLVKSHLMFAVREEVEVLKEKIVELMEKITQLEADNNILRANATPEVLAQLKNQNISSTVS